MKVLVISSDYPSHDNVYGQAFVHTRLKEYSEVLTVEVVGFNETIEKEQKYTYEGISVYITGNLFRFYEEILDRNPDVIIGHIVRYHYLKFLLSLHKPLLFFFHGYDVTSWKRRLMNYASLGALPYLWTYMWRNKKQLAELRSFIRASKGNSKIRFVFVSNWLLKAAQSDLGMTITNAHVIPNGIDTSRFNFHVKTPSLRKKILILRSFKANNYANDVAIEAILLLSKKDFFYDLQFSIYGEGYLFKKVTNRVRHLPNVTLNNFFVENKDIPDIHKSHGIFLCPSRLDTQGVSMCEAMASGLVPITSPVGGIPEYSANGISSFHVETSRELAEKIEYLYKNPDAFTAMSIQARKAVTAKCELHKTIEMELNLIQSLRSS